jgi:predicted ATP-dependent serine protease
MAGEDAATHSPASRKQQKPSHLPRNTNPLADRLPTVSASQALQNLHARGARTVSTGISILDQVLSPPSLPGHNVSGGYMRGKVTEIFGPSGVGKTAFG